MADAAKDMETRISKIRDSVDFNIAGDNIGDIAEFTVEKYEFRNGVTLSAETRERAIAQIMDVLWQRMEQLRVRRQQVLADMFNAAEATLNDVLSQRK